MTWSWMNNDAWMAFSRTHSVWHHSEQTNKHVSQLNKKCPINPTPLTLAPFTGPPHPLTLNEMLGWSDAWMESYFCNTNKQNKQPNKQTNKPKQINKQTNQTQTRPLNPTPLITTPITVLID